jgi:uncharacterized protein YjbI with pentapeptide repeats
MARLTIRTSTVDLPAFDPETEYCELTALTGTDSISDFCYRDVSLRTLEIGKTRLLSGRIEKVRSVRTTFTEVRADSIEFAGCDLSSLTWSDSKLTRVQFTNCKLLGAQLTDLVLEHVAFVNCKLDYAGLTSIRSAGPLIFSGCSLSETRIEDCDLSRALLGACALNSTEFARGTYRGLDLRGNDVSSVRGVAHLAGIRIEHSQTLQLAEALAIDLNVSFGDA